MKEHVEFWTAQQRAIGDDGPMFRPDGSEVWFRLGDSCTLAGAREIIEITKRSRASLSSFIGDTGASVFRIRHFVGTRETI